MKRGILLVLVTINLHAYEVLMIDAKKRAALGAFLAERCMKKQNKRVKDNMDQFVKRNGFEYLPRIIASPVVCLDPCDKQDRKLHRFIQRLAKHHYTQQVQQEISQEIEKAQERGFLEKEQLALANAQQAQATMYLPASYNFASLFFSVLTKQSEHTYEEQLFIISQQQHFQEMLKCSHGFSLLLKRQQHIQM